MKNRQQLAELFRDKGFTTGVEVGVHRGYYSQTLAKTIPDLTLYAVDPWVMPERFKDNGETLTASHKAAIDRLEPLGVTLMQQTSMDAVRYFAPHSIDFVYIDGDHSFDGVMGDLIEWGRRVKKRGIIAGHDYTEGTAVIEAVDMYVKHHGLELIVTEELDDKARSWYVIKKWGY